MMNDYVLPLSPAVHGELRQHEHASILQTLLWMLQEARDRRQDHQPLSTVYVHLYIPMSNLQNALSSEQTERKPWLSVGVSAGSEGGWEYSSH